MNDGPRQVRSRGRRGVTAPARGLAVAGALLMGVAGLATAATRPAKPPPAAPKAAGVQTVRIRDDVYVLTGAGANVVVQVGDQGAVVVDPGDATHADQILTAIRLLTDKPIRYIFDTSDDADAAGANAILAKAGRAFGQSLGGPFGAPGPAVVVATGNAAGRLEQDADSDGWPARTITVRGAYFLNGQGIEAIAKPAAHGDGDLVVLFRRSDVLATGAIFDIDRFPVIDTKDGGTIQGEVDALDDLIDMAIPNAPVTWLPGGTLVVPAHGRVCQQAELVQYRDMVAIVRDRVKALKDKGQSLAQVLQSDPTAGYGGLYGGSGPATDFVTAIYNTLPAVGGAKS